jgi:hypothetical protein
MRKWQQEDRHITTVVGEKADNGRNSSSTSSSSSSESQRKKNVVGYDWARPWPG